MQPIIVSTWSFGMKANAAGWPILQDRKGLAIDAVEAACCVVEADPEVDSVGYGGLPDSAGTVSLDGAIMLSPQDCGAVCNIKRFVHPVAIARRVMERTPHVMLAGNEADRFAQNEGFVIVEELLTDKAREVWQKWQADPHQLTEGRYKGWVPPRNIEELRGLDKHDDRESENQAYNKYHDTIGVIALDSSGVLCAGCSTSGMAFKVPGRVGDSPIIGHGLYVDPEAGAAVATGTGELIMGVCGSFLAVECLRNKLTVQQAALTVIQRIADSFDLHDDHQAAILVMDRQGNWSAASLRTGYRTAVTTESQNELITLPENVFIKSPEEQSLIDSDVNTFMDKDAGNTDLDNLSML